MAAVPARYLCRYLLRGRSSLRTATAITSCPQCAPLLGFRHDRRRLSSSTTPSSTPTSSPTSRRPQKPTTPLPIALRKLVKEEAKARKAAGAAGSAKSDQAHGGQTVPGWELTVGIEIHAQLNTARKLFSAATATDSTASSAPNTRVAFFDLSLPGAQPIFQAATLVPAIRAALALNCEIQRVSRFDRKHYFHWDQPSGYQITQFYEPFARRGHIDLFARDGIAPEDGDCVRIDIQQVQMEQDTAKTVAQPGGVHWLDFNRVGMPLIEIITAPQLHHPATAAALVRKIQALLLSVDACTSGMEAGGLRADVNVSVRRAVGGGGAGAAAEERGLGVRTEIKNLNSFRAVEDAIIAERNRQIAAIEAAEAGGRSPAEAVVSETRGWTPGSGGGAAGTTHRLRGKEGEVDYRYMPDPDLAPVVIDEGLVRFLQLTLGASPDDELESLVAGYGLTATDAAALMLLDGGGRAQYYYDVVDAVEARLSRSSSGPAESATSTNADVRAFVANWVLHQLGRLTSERNVLDAASASGVSGVSGTAVSAPASDLGMTPEGRCRIPVACLADILAYRYEGRITANVAKELLFAVFRGDIAGGGRPTMFSDVTHAIDQGGLWFDEIAAGEYRALAEQALEGEHKTLRLFVDAALKPSPKKKYPQGKLQFLVGKLLRLGPEGRMDPQNAEAAVRAAIEQHVASVGGGA